MKGIGNLGARTYPDSNPKPPGPKPTINHWAVLSDEQMRKIWPFSLLNDEQMSNKVGVKHQPDH